MGRYRNEGAYEAGVDALDNLLAKCPELKAKAGKKLEELVKELSLECKQGECVVAAPKQASANVDPAQKIKHGFQEFQAHFKKEQTLFKALTESQHPKWMIIACCDSRVDPAVVLGMAWTWEKLSWFATSQAWLLQNLFEPYEGGLMDRN
ncbi:hypothetical protein L7F22_038655 [Adiantum nelumboides]|nr:hypothetical protein [Adiantum nelumboides]